MTRSYITLVRAAIVLAASSLLLGWCPTPSHAQQFQNVREGSEDRNEGLYEAKKVVTALLVPVDVRTFPRSMTFKEALGILYEQVNQHGRELPILVDQAAFEAKSPGTRDVHEALVTRPPVSRGTVTAAQMLETFLAQLPPGAGWLVRRDYVEITTTSKLPTSESLVELLNSPVDQCAFRRPMPLHEMLSTLSAQLSNRKRRVQFWWDERVFPSTSRRPVDVLPTMICLPNGPRSLTVSQFLHYALQPLRNYEPTLLVHQDGFEITTVERAAVWRMQLGQFGKPVTMMTWYGGGIFGR
jgi:hypothetical protein